MRMIVLKTMLLAGCVAAGSAQKTVPPANPEVTDVRTTRIVLVGDSTVNHSTGWGGGFCDRLAGDLECFDSGRNGRSSKSYMDQGLWKRALALHPDIVLIQFGANDTPGKGPDRETAPETTFAALIRQYVTEARAAGAKPMLVTPLPGRSYKDGKHVRTLEDYAAAMRKVGAEMKVPVLDLNADANALLDGMTQEQADAWDHVYVPPQPKPDRVHLNEAGIDVFGAMVAKEFAAAMPEMAKKVSLYPAAGGK
jgi:lysophospholipase L1-like esterase